jgi:hypothetical protein
MPPAGGKRTSLTQLAREPIASYSWGGWGTQNDITQFSQVLASSGWFKLLPIRARQSSGWRHCFGMLRCPRSLPLSSTATRPDGQNG